MRLKAPKLGQRVNEDNIFLCGFKIWIFEVTGRQEMDSEQCN